MYLPAAGVSIVFFLCYGVITFYQDMAHVVHRARRRRGIARR